MTASSPHPSLGIKTTVESPEPWQRVVKVEITRDVYDKAFATRLKKAVKSHQKPGFRKGKAPKALVVKELGDVLRVETIEDMVPKAWMSALLEHKLAAITDPVLEDLKFEDDQPLTFDLVVEVRPEIELSDYEGLAVKKRAAEVKPVEVDEVIARLRESRAAFEKVERAAVEGDQILLDLTPLDDEAEGEPTTIEDQQLVLGAEQNLPAFNEQLQGCEAGQEKEVSVDYPADFPNEKLQGRTMHFRCVVKEISAKVVPEADDEFAASIQEGKTMADLREEISADLLKEASRRVQQELDMQIRGELISRHEVSLPPSMVKKYLEAGLADFHAHNERQGKAATEEGDKEYMEAARPMAEKALKGMLLLEAVRLKEEIKVTDDDVDEKIGEIAAENGFDVDRYREFVNSGEEKDRISYDLAERRTYDFLLSRAEIEEVSADADLTIP